MGRKKKSTSTIGRSKFEDTLIKRLKGCDYEPIKVTYISERSYTPDFIPRTSPTTLIEAKGRFRTSGEARKYVDIQKSNPDLQIIFIFMAPETPMPNAKRRKDGTKRSHAEWAESHGFTYYSVRNLPEEWIKE